MNSIRHRTAMLVAASVAVLLALGGLTLFAVVRASLTHQFDDGLISRAVALQSLTRFDGRAVEMDIAGEVMPRYQPGAEAECFVAWERRATGWVILERSESLGGGAWSLAGDEPPSPGSTDCVLPDGRAARALVIEFVAMADRERADEADGASGTGGTPLPAPVLRLLVAQARAGLDRTLRTVAVAIGAVGVALVLSSLVATRWAVRRGTAPLEALSARVAALGPETLAQRLDCADLPSELVPVTDRLNNLLARLAEAFARERRFASAASHELRTPIAELRALFEVALVRERDAAHWARAAHEGLAVLERAQRLTEALLRLSRAHVGGLTCDPEAVVDLEGVVRQQVARALGAGNHDATRVLIDAVGPLVARIDAASAASIVGNLIDNALVHGEVAADRPVRCRAAREGAWVCVTIINHAPALSDADVVRFFEPFWRKDAARDTRGGFGLGLAVSRALAESVGGSLAARLDASGRVSVVLRVPAVQPLVAQGDAACQQPASVGPK